MMQEQSFYICETCGNLVGMIHSSGVQMNCCGKPMKALVANDTDAAQEKHVPVVEVSGDICKVKIGAAEHPMTEEHLIDWVYIQTENGGQRKKLHAGAAPEAVFRLMDDKPVEAYAYCNLHGLWKADI